MTTHSPIHPGEVLQEDFILPFSKRRAMPTGSSLPAREALVGLHPYNDPCGISLLTTDNRGKGILWANDPVFPLYNSLYDS